MEQQARPLDVAQEGVAEARAGACALDQAGHVGDRRPALVGGVEDGQVEHAEVRLECREGVGRDPGPRRRERREQGRLAGVGQPHQPHVGDAGAAPGAAAAPHPVRPSGRGAERAGSRWRSARCPGRHARRGRPARAGPARRGPRAGRHSRRRRRPCRGAPSVPGRRRHGRGAAPAPPAPPAAARKWCSKRYSRSVVSPDVHTQVDRAAPPTVTAVGPAPRHVGLAPERRGTGTAVAGAHQERDPIEEHRAPS